MRKRVCGYECNVKGGVGEIYKELILNLGNRLTLTAPCENQNPGREGETPREGRVERRVV